MSGILKRKFLEVEEEDSSPPCSLLPEFDDVSASDSGNSNDSVNAPTTQLIPSSILKRSKRMRMRGISFQGVTVYYFSRRQGFTSVPTQGGSSLGMSPRHSWVRRFTLGEFAREQEKAHRNMLRNHLKEEKLNAIKLKLTKTGLLEAEDMEAAAVLSLEDIREEEIDVASAEVDEYFFLQPLGIRKRRALLRASGVRRIDSQERHQLRAIRVSRKDCGCQCRGHCSPETCACSQAGIKCQVDRMAFPCGCSKDGCGNTAGRIEFNPARVRTHFLHTLMKLELEQQQEQQHSLYFSAAAAGNGYHGDGPLAQSQRNSDCTLMEPPNIYLESANELESCLQEGEYEEEECYDEDDDDDEEGEEDEETEEEETEEEEDEDEESEQDEEEDGSSLLSGLSDSSTHSLAGSDLEEEEEDEEDEDEVQRQWQSGKNMMSLGTQSVSLPSVSLPSVSLASTMPALSNLSSLSPLPFQALPSFSQALREAEGPELHPYFTSPSTHYYSMESYSSSSCSSSSAPALLSSNYSASPSSTHYNPSSQPTPPNYTSSPSPLSTPPNYSSTAYPLSAISPTFTVLENAVNVSLSGHTRDAMYTGSEYTDSNQTMADYPNANHMAALDCNHNPFDPFGSFTSVTTAATDGATKLCHTQNMNSVQSIESFSIISESYKDLDQSQLPNGHHPYALSNQGRSPDIGSSTDGENNHQAAEDLKDSSEKDRQEMLLNHLNNNPLKMIVANGNHVGDQDQDLAKGPKHLQTDMSSCLSNGKQDLITQKNHLGEVNQA